MRKASKKHSAIAKYKDKSQKDKKVYFVIAGFLFVLLLVGKITMNYSIYYIIFATLASIVFLFSEDIPFFNDREKKSTAVLEDMLIENDATIGSDTTRQ
ncbi:hypothetical protein [Candidatus Uabimicrobium amorphum]|nr:hypothetical protein [Candidatus Uabimicrobium amorphum]